MKFIRHIAIFSSILLISVLNGNAQKSLEGRVVVHNDPLFDTLLFQFDSVQRIKAANPDNMGIDGFRVQIFFDSGTYSGDRANEVKEAFEENYEGVRAYVTWKAPNYRVRVGDFRSRLEAEKFLREVSEDYPNAWVIKDEINFPDLK
jgi:translation initiation factor 2 alpha subunit (eIF-2alpha)